jgi:aspartate/glutamate racemase
MSAVKLGGIKNLQHQNPWDDAADNKINATCSLAKDSAVVAPIGANAIDKLYEEVQNQI